MEKERLERDQAAEDDEEEQADLMDIDFFFTKKGQGPRMLEFEFVPVTDDPVEFISDRTGKQTRCWTWKHKLTDVEIKQYPTKLGQSFDTGVLSYYLNQLKERPHKVAFDRARHVLKLNSKGHRNVKDAMLLHLSSLADMRR